MSTATVSALSVTPVKATRLHAVEEVELTEMGAVGDRRFYVVDDRDRMVNAKRLGSLQAIVADLDVARDALSLRFPDGSDVAAPVELGAPLETRFLSRPRSGRLVEGPFGAALSEHFGTPLRLVAPDTGADRGRRGAASIVSRASLRRLAEAAETDGVDARRFRMLIEIDGVDAHEEDSWVQRRVRVGDALLRVSGHVGRCLVTGLDPDRGEPDLPTLDLLGAYRRDLQSTEPLPFGVYAQVLEPGRVRVGDPLSTPD